MERCLRQGKQMYDEVEGIFALRQEQLEVFLKIVDFVAGNQSCVMKDVTHCASNPALPPNYTLMDKGAKTCLRKQVTRDASPTFPYERLS